MFSSFDVCVEAHDGCVEAHVGHLQVKAGIPIVLDPGLLARAMKNNLFREQQAEKPLGSRGS